MTHSVKTRFKAVLVTALLTLTALVSTASPASAEIGRPTKFTGTSLTVWAHFKPTLDSAYLPVSAVDLRAVCSVVAANGVVWNLVYDNHNMRTGFTYASYLKSPELNQGCWNVGRATGGVTADSWVHLYPQANWAHMVISPGHDIAALCTLGDIYDPTDGNYRWWGLFLDHATNTVGFTWETSFRWLPTVPSCYTGS